MLSSPNGTLDLDYSINYEDLKHISTLNKNIADNIPHRILLKISPTDYMLQEINPYGGHFESHREYDTTNQIMSNSII